MRVDLHPPEARAEFRSATLWYEERRDGLGAEFVAAIDAAFQRISKAPKSFPRWPGTEKAPTIIRKTRVERFPYIVEFEQHERHLFVLGVAHQKRRPPYWLSRSGQEPGYQGDEPAAAGFGARDGVLVNSLRLSRAFNRLQDGPRVATLGFHGKRDCD